jgi:inhibitor of KinA sporulation pathway (predicted exonuclease)
VIRNSKFKYYCVVDFEATCVEDRDPTFVQEIIEFPAVLLDGSTFEIVRSFLFFALFLSSFSSSFFFFFFF